MTCTRCGQQMMAGTHLCASCWVAVLPADQARSGRYMVIAVAALVVAAAITGTTLVFARSWPRPAGDRAAATQLQAPRTVPTIPAAGAAPARGPGAAASPAAPPVAVTPMAATGPHSGAALAFLTRYFTAINGHRYWAYLRLFSRESRNGLSAAQFRAGYQTTRDVRPTLVALESGGPGRLAATVAFTSHQRADTSALRAACVRWIITLYLVRDGRRYVIGNPPAHYVATGRAC